MLLIPTASACGLHRGQARALPHLGLDVGSQKRINEPHVVVQACFVDVVGGSVREDARPGDGKAVVGYGQVLQGDHVLRDLVVTVTGHICDVIILNPQPCVSKRVPNTKAFAICSPCTFNLTMTRKTWLNSVIWSNTQEILFCLPVSAKTGRFPASPLQEPSLASPLVSELPWLSVHLHLHYITICCCECVSFCLSSCCPSDTLSSALCLVDTH